MVRYLWILIILAACTSNTQRVKLGEVTTSPNGFDGYCVRHKDDTKPTGCK